MPEQILINISTPSNIWQKVCGKMYVGPKIYILGSPHLSQVRGILALCTVATKSLATRTRSTLSTSVAVHSAPSVAQIPETEPAAAERDYGISSTAQLELPGEDNGGGSQPSYGIHLGTHTDYLPHAG